MCLHGKAKAVRLGDTGTGAAGQLTSRLTFLNAGGGELQLNYLL